MLRLINLFLGKLGVDSAILFTIFSRIIQAAGGIISIIFIAFFLNKEEQGYYYTFASILAVQIFFELGLSGILTQYTAHEFAHLKFEEDGKISGPIVHQSRLSSLLYFCVKWFGIISFFLLILLIIVGFVFFSRYESKANIDWKTPWVILCVSTALNLFIDPLLAFFEGIGLVRDMAKVRLVQKSTNVILLLVFFSLGFKLYSAALASLVAILVNFAQIFFSTRIRVLKKVWYLKGEFAVNYLKEIFPFQWRIALSWISGYFIFQLFNPVLFATEGAATAGQMGMTLQALNGIAGVSMSWIVTKVPAFSAFIATRNFKGLNRSFDATLKQLAIVNLGLSAIFIGGIFLLQLFHSPFSSRFLSLWPSLLFTITAFANQIIFAWATYLRCHKKEPFLINSIVVGLLVSCSTFIVGKAFGLLGITYGYFLITLCIAVPWSYYIFNFKKRQWHFDRL